MNLKTEIKEMDTEYGGWIVQKKLFKWLEFFNKIMKKETIKKSETKVSYSFLKMLKQDDLINMDIDDDVKISKTSRLTQYKADKIIKDELQRRRRIRTRIRLLKEGKIKSIFDRSKVIYKKGTLLQCFHCNLIFIKDKQICPLCKNKKDFIKKTIHPANVDIIETHNKDIVWRFLEAKKGRMEGLPVVEDPKFFVRDHSDGDALYWHGKLQETFELCSIRKIEDYIIGMVSPGLLEKATEHNKKIREKKEKGIIISIQKISDCVKFPQFGNVRLVIITPRLKGYIQLLHQKGYLNSEDISKIDMVNNDYEQQIRLKEQIQEFVDNALKKIKGIK